MTGGVEARGPGNCAGVASAVGGGEWRPEYRRMRWSTAAEAWHLQSDDRVRPGSGPQHIPELARKRHGVAREVAEVGHHAQRPVGAESGPSVLVKPVHAGAAIACDDQRATRDGEAAGGARLHRIDGP